MIEMKVTVVYYKVCREEVEINDKFSAMTEDGGRDEMSGLALYDLEEELVAHLAKSVDTDSYHIKEIYANEEEMIYENY